MVQLSLSNCVAEISTLYVGVALAIYYTAVPAHDASRTKTRRKKKEFSSRRTAEAQSCLLYLQVMLILAHRSLHFFLFLFLYIYVLFFFSLFCCSLLLCVGGCIDSLLNVNVFERIMHFNVHAHTYRCSLLTQSFGLSAICSLSFFSLLRSAKKKKRRKGLLLFSASQRHVSFFLAAPVQRVVVDRLSGSAQSQ